MSVSARGGSGWLGLLAGAAALAARHEWPRAMAAGVGRGLAGAPAGHGVRVRGQARERLQQASELVSGSGGEARVAAGHGCRRGGVAWPELPPAMASVRGARLASASGCNKQPGPRAGAPAARREQLWPMVSMREVGLAKELLPPSRTHTHARNKVLRTQRVLQSSFWPTYHIEGLKKGVDCSSTKKHAR